MVSLVHYQAAGLFLGSPSFKQNMCSGVYVFCVDIRFSIFKNFKFSFIQKF